MWEYYFFFATKYDLSVNYYKYQKLEHTKNICIHIQ
jgi:hypothetical protein